MIHEKPDVYYTAAVRKTLTDKQFQFQGMRAEDGTLSDLHQQRLDTCTTLLNGMVKWAELQAVTSDNPAAARAALTNVANAIYPMHGGHEHLAASLDQEKAELPTLRRDLEQEQDRLEQEQKQLIAQASQDAGASDGRRLDEIALRVELIPLEIKRIDDRLFRCQ